MDDPQAAFLRQWGRERLPARPGPELLEAVHRAGTAVMVSGLGLSDTVRAFEELLRP